MLHQSFLPVFFRLVVSTVSLWFSITFNDLFAQELTDTIQIKEISISSKEIKKFQAGAKVETIPNPIFKNLQDGSLETLLSRSTTLSLKSTAGGLSTIRFRGTSPDHTSINFGGINLNSLTLGHSNMSNIPMYLFDEVGVQFGSSSAVNGSGSIGGAIHLGLKNYWVDGFKAEARVAHGSFGEQLYGTKLFIGNGKWEAVTRLYYYNEKNNFKFLNTSIKDFTTGKVGIEDTQKNADIENMGLLHELKYRFSQGETLKLRVWFESDWHLIQQNQASNYYTPEKRETYKDEHIRAWGSYDNQKHKLKYHFGAGYVYDNSIYNNTPDPIKTNRIIGDFFVEHDISENGSYKLGAKASQITPEVYAYGEDLKHENRIDLFLSYNQQFFDRLRITLNLRQGFVTDYELPFVPAVGLSFKLLDRNQHYLALNGNIAKSYRVPTFNDRYWVPGGNPDLKPEEGINYELGVEHSYLSDDFNSTIKINAFFMDVDNWVLWRNGGAYWYAENVQKVESKGIEVSGDVKYRLGNLKISHGLNYAYTNTQRKSSINESSAIDRQLEYVPLHKGLIFSSVEFKQFNISIDGSYTHEQYTDETLKNILAPYFLLNTVINYNFRLNKNHRIRLSGMINNLLNKNYQSTIDYAMPRINYRISLTYNFN